MNRQPDDFDPTAPDERLIGEGMFTEEMGPSSSLAHLYRAEVHRMQFWRARLDRTTKWAVTVIAALLTWAFSSANHPHYLILIAIVMLFVFLSVEARRFRGYDLWRSRVRLLQENVLATALDPSAGVEDTAWRRKLSEDYRTPKVKIPLEEAYAHRLRRIYLPLFLVLIAAWIIRITVFAPHQWPTSAAIATIPGSAVTAAVVVFYVLLCIIAGRPRQWRANGELRITEVGDWNDAE